MFQINVTRRPHPKSDRTTMWVDRRLAPRRGKKKAVVAVVHTILVVIYNVIAKGTEYRDLGSDYFDRLQADRLTRYYLRRLNELGVDVSPA